MPVLPHPFLLCPFKGHESTLVVPNFILHSRSTGWGYQASQATDTMREGEHSSFYFTKVFCTGF